MTAGRVTYSGKEMKALRSQNYYEVLGISRYASPEEIRNAYELSKLTFTENSIATYSLFSEEENEAILELIAQACETLLNPELRREYDAYLDKHERGETLSWEGRAPAAPIRGERPRRDPGEESRATPPRPATERAAVPPRRAKEGVEEPKPKPKSKPSEVERYIETTETFSGETLRRVREMRSLSLVDLADTTKIRNTYIAYIEEENYAGLPAAVYVKGFVKLIAQALSLPADKVTHDYMARYRSRTTKNRA